MFKEYEKIYFIVPSVGHHYEVYNIEAKHHQPGHSITQDTILQSSVF